jgi:hypothetical protein
MVMPPECDFDACEMVMVVVVMMPALIHSCPSPANLQPEPSGKQLGTRDAGYVP